MVNSKIKLSAVVYNIVVDLYLFFAETLFLLENVYVQEVLTPTLSFK